MNRFRPAGSGTRPRSPRRRVLLVSEAVTLAQIVRLVQLGSALDPSRYDVHFASADFPEFIFGGTNFSRWPLETVPRSHVDRALATGRRLYDRGTLERYVRSDLAVIDRARPELIAGDFRWSLSISARKSGVPLATLANAYWCPCADRDALPLPEHPIVRLLGVRLAARYFPRAIPFVFDHFARPLNDLRREHGLPPVGSLPDVITHGDYTLYADTPFIAPIRRLASTHRYIGPVLWSPGGNLPPAWGTDSRRLPIYVTFGSSGPAGCLVKVVRALSRLPLDLLVATAGRVSTNGWPASVRVADFIPGQAAARRARVVVTHGGSTTAYQALAEGTPVVGIPYNLDQYLSMQGIARTGAGILLRSGTLQENSIVRAVCTSIEDEKMLRAAAMVAEDFARYSSSDAFCRFVDEVLAGAIQVETKEKSHVVP